MAKRKNRPFAIAPDGPAKLKKSRKRRQKPIRMKRSVIAGGEDPLENAINKIEQGGALTQIERYVLVEELRKMKTDDIHAISHKINAVRKALPSTKRVWHDGVLIEGTIRSIIQERLPKKEPHGQESHYREIIKNPEIFYGLSKEETQERISRIDQAFEKFSSRIKKYARFNRTFYEGLLEKDDRKPISLVDDIGFFEWPLTEISGTGMSGTFNTDLQPKGVLGVLGYNVQVDGPNFSSRCRTLSRFFEGELSLPRSLPEAYLAEWGNPKRSLRLKKMAHSIASFVRQQRRRHFSSSQAIDKWEADLEYLKNKYYRQFQRKFRWPST